jgi:hypothetical protein
VPPIGPISKPLPTFSVTNIGHSRRKLEGIAGDEQFVGTFED